MLASVATFAIEGVTSREVTVEVDLRRGLPAFTVVGLPDRAVRESRERVRAAMLNSGPSFDLALAVAVLAASNQLPRHDLTSYAVCGELSLSGALRPIHGAVAVADGARRSGYARLIVPEENAAEAALVDGIDVLGVPSLDRMAELFAGAWTPPPPSPPQRARRAAEPFGDLADVR